MALTIAIGCGCRTGTGILYRASTSTPCTSLSFLRHVLLPPSNRTRTLPIVRAKKFSSRTGRFENKNRRSGTTTKDQEDEEDQDQTLEIDSVGPNVENTGIVFENEENLPELPGEKPDFWEGPQWDAFGFFVEYLWAFGIVFALISSGIAVATYNEGASDFKGTPAYKESVQSRELLEGSNPDVFESNPTEVAPSLE